jgi:hypothetical protein
LKEVVVNSILRQESELTERTDEEVKILLADANEKIKRLKEAEKNDPAIVEMKSQLKMYVDQHYGASVKKLSVLLKALRRQAAIRGIQFEGATRVIEDNESNNKENTAW